MQVVAPNQHWFHFLVDMNKRFADLDAGAVVGPKKRQENSSTADRSSTEGVEGEKDGKSDDNKESDAEGTFKLILDKKGLPDIERMEYEYIRNKWKRSDPLTEAEVKEMTASHIRYFAGGAQQMAKGMSLSNALVVNRRRGRAFEGSSVVEFNNLIMKVPGVEPRAACCVQLVHPVVGPMQIYSLHLDHVWEKNRQRQFEALLEQRLNATGSLPHIIMGDFNAITETDYSTWYEKKMIRDVRENGKWEPPTYTLMQYIKSLGYIDLWRHLNPEIKDSDVTTCAYNTRIDYIFVSPSLAAFIDWEHEKTYSHILNGVTHSDHYPVMANIQFKTPGTKA